MLIYRVMNRKHFIQYRFNRKEKRMIKYIDLFAGIGGFRYSLDSLGWKCVFSSEINPQCREVYYQNYGEYPEGDITKIDASDIPDFDVLCGGFPCQPFSICGKQNGFEDTRGTLFFDICRIVKEKHPKVIFLENVKNLAYHDKKNTIQVICSHLNALGYHISWKILNAKDFGSAQSRERIIIMGIRKNFGDPFDFDHLPYHSHGMIQDILEPDSSSSSFIWADKNTYTLLPEEKIKVQDSGLIFVGYMNKNIRKNGVLPNTEHLSRSHRQTNRIYSVMGTHPTLCSQETSGRYWIYLPDKQSVRKLTLRECYRLMGFPDTFCISPYSHHAYLQAGNSVSIQMITAVGMEIQCLFLPFQSTPPIY